MLLMAWASRCSKTVVYTKDTLPKTICMGMVEESLLTEIAMRESLIPMKCMATGSILIW